MENRKEYGSGGWVGLSPVLIETSALRPCRWQCFISIWAGVALVYKEFRISKSFALMDVIGITTNRIKQFKWIKLCHPLIPIFHVNVRPIWRLTYKWGAVCKHLLELLKWMGSVLKASLIVIIAYDSSKILHSGAIWITDMFWVIIGTSWALANDMIHFIQACSPIGAVRTDSRSPRLALPLVKTGWDLPQWHRHHEARWVRAPLLFRLPGHVPHVWSCLGLRWNPCSSFSKCFRLLWSPSGLRDSGLPPDVY